MEEDLLPSEALPSLIHVMKTFNMALHQHIQLVTQYQNVEILKQVLSPLREDLNHFIVQFDGLHQNAETAEEYLYLQEFAKYLGCGQQLVKEAERVIELGIRND